jgi:hypothetical protein
MHPTFDGVLFFPVTPFTESGDVDHTPWPATSPTASTPAPVVS